MRITVFGATGSVGQLVVSEAIARGHTVVAFQRKQAPASTNSNLRLYQGDIYDKKAVTAALNGSDAVISALGSWGTPKKDILTTGARHIIPGMQAYGISRIVSLTGADARAAGDQLGLLHRLSYPLLTIAAGRILRDGEEHIRLLARSDLDWTVVRSPVMLGNSTAGGYTLSRTRPMPWVTVRRQAVAVCLVDLAEQADQSRQSPFIYDT